VRPSGSFGARGVVGAELDQSSGCDPIDPAVADVEHEYAGRRDRDARDRRAHAVPDRALVHQPEQLVVGLVQQMQGRGLAGRCRGTPGQALGHGAARHVARGMTAHAIGDQADQRRRDLVLQHHRRRHRQSSDPVADRDRVLVAGAHGALMRERRRAQMNRRRHGSPRQCWRLHASLLDRRRRGQRDRGAIADRRGQVSLVIASARPGQRVF
jgi:hypothetical protein